MSKTKPIALILGVLAMSIFVGYLVLAWTEPTQAPPGGNVPAPLNTSINAQSKEGALVIGTNGAVTTGLIVQNGNVGIGTTEPGAKLEVAGQVKITGGSPGAKKVLTSDVSGLASWQTPAGGGDGTPTGGIIMYSGAWNFDGTGLGTGSLAGWALCNGNNGTPNLSDRFVMGTVSSPTPGATGGSVSHSHGAGTYAAPNHTHSIPNHTHSIPNHTHTIPNHTHSFSGNTGSVNDKNAMTGLGGAIIYYVNSHTHSFSGTTGSGGGGTTGSGGGGTTGSGGGGTTGLGGAAAITGTSASASNLPPYLKLAFIMKL